MLKKAEEIIGLLRCPSSGQPITYSPENQLYTSEDNAYSYNSVEQTPILINFQDFIDTEADFFNRQAASAIKRAAFGDKKQSLLKKLVRNPVHSTKENMATLHKLLVKGREKSKLLIVGGGERGYFTDIFYNDPNIDVIAFDIYYTDNLTFIADAHSMPLQNESVDAVIIQAVLEHVLDPAIVVSEIYRVLKKDGLVYAETPFMQPVHEGAYDFTRYTESGHRYLFKQFEELNAGASCGAGTNLMWSVDYFFRSLFRSKAAGKVGKLLFFWLKYFDALMDKKQIIDAANGVFFLGRKSTNSIRPKAIIERYKGAY